MVIELAPELRRERGAAAALRHLWGILVTSAAAPRVPRHYISMSRRRDTGLRRSVERASALIAPERLLAVTTRREDDDGHASGGPALDGVQMVVQPSWRGSAAEIFLPILRIHRDDPHATVVVLGPDRLLEHQPRLMHYVSRAARAVALRRDVPVMIGAPPSAPDPGRAWIEPGDPIEGLEPFAIRSVARFVPHPTVSEAMRLFEGGGLLSTLVVIARAETLIELGRRTVPDVLETLEPLEQAFGDPEERLLSDALWEHMPVACFAADVLERSERFAVLAMPDVAWREVSTSPLALAS
jgi:mannose-1-phosphate guanylyltransferase